MRHVEQALLGLQALEPADRGPLDRAQADVERLRSLLWNGRHIGIFVGRSQGKLREQIVGWLEKR